MPTTVTNEPVGPEDELPPHLPTEMEAGVVHRCVHVGWNFKLREYGFRQGLHGCESAGRSDLGSHELAILRTSWLVSVARSGLLDDERAVTGEDAGAGGAASGVVPLARGADPTAPGICSSRSNRDSGTHCTHDMRVWGNTLHEQERQKSMQYQDR